jgi:hypothetical protein
MYQPIKGKAEKVSISAFPDFREFRRHIDHMAWEREIWVEVNPDHPIHSNGPEFFRAYEAIF